MYIKVMYKIIFLYNIKSDSDIKNNIIIKYI
jgi:hypothetical protein